MDPQLSIIVPVCNVEKYLAACLKSAINQSFKNIELICVNDGSSDSSLQILESYAKEDDRIVIIDKENAGYGAAMNDGLKIARGEYIGVLESDDRVCENAWKELYDTAKKNDLDLIRGNYIHSKFGQEYYFEANRKMAETYPEDIPEAPYDTVFTPTDYPKCFWINPSIWTGLFRREFLIENDIWFNETPGASYQDTAFAFKTWAVAKRAMLVKTPVIYYTMDNESSSSNSRSKIFAVCDETHEIERYISERDLDPICAKALSAVRYKTYVWNASRIHEDYKQEFDELMWREMAIDYSKGRCDKESFRRNDLEIIERHATSSPIVSVIVPISDSCKNIEKCIDSVLAQDLINFEIICVDYSSNEEMDETLNTYEEADARIKVIQHPYDNDADAKNIGFKEARGSYLLFLNPTNYISQKMLNDLSTLADDSNLDIAFCKINEVNLNNNSIIKQRNPVLNKLKQRTLYSSNDLWGYAFRYVNESTCNKLFRRSFLNNNDLSFEDVGNWDDSLFIYASFVLADRIMFLNSRMAFVPRSEESSDEKELLSDWPHMISAFDSMKKCLVDHDLVKAASRDFDNWIASKLIRCLKFSPEKVEDLYYQVKNEYAIDLSSKNKGYFYKSGVLYKFKIWSSCDYELAMETFKIRETSLKRSKEIKKLKSQNVKLKSEIRSLKKSKLYRLTKKLKS